MKFRQYSLRFFFFFFLFTYFYCILDFFKNKVMSDVGIKARASLNFTFPPTSSPPKPPAPTPFVFPNLFSVNKEFNPRALVQIPGSLTLALPLLLPPIPGMGKHHSLNAQESPDRWQTQKERPHHQGKGLSTTIPIPDLPGGAWKHSKVLRQTQQGVGSQVLCHGEQGHPKLGT